MKETKDKINVKKALKLLRDLSGETLEKTIFTTYYATFDLDEVIQGIENVIIKDEEAEHRGY